MKLTKRILCLMLAMALTVALCACGDKKEEEKKDSTPTNHTVPTTQTTTDDWSGNLEGENQFNDAVLDWGE